MKCRVPSIRVARLVCCSRRWNGSYIALICNHYTDDDEDEEDDNDDDNEDLTLYLLDIPTTWQTTEHDQSTEHFFHILDVQHESEARNCLAWHFLVSPHMQMLQQCVKTGHNCIHVFWLTLVVTVRWDYIDNEASNWACCTAPHVRWAWSIDGKIIDCGKLKYWQSDENLFLCQFVHHKSFMVTSGLNPGLIQWEASNYLAELWHGCYKAGLPATTQHDSFRS
jgi:hypothetical protein